MAGLDMSRVPVTDRLAMAEATAVLHRSVDELAEIYRAREEAATAFRRAEQDRSVANDDFDRLQTECEDAGRLLWDGLDIVETASHRWAAEYMAVRGVKQPWARRQAAREVKKVLGDWFANPPTEEQQ